MAIARCTFVVTTAKTLKFGASYNHPQLSCDDMSIEGPVTRRTKKI
jgi:hypothetical protein